MSPLSKGEAERPQQVHILVGFGILFTGLVVVLLTRFALVDWGGFLPKETGSVQHGDQERPLLALRSAFGAAFALWACRLVWLVRRHREEIRTTYALRGQYVGTGIAQAVFAVVPGFAGMWWPGIAGAAVLVIAALLAWRITPIPVEQMERSIEVVTPRTWDAEPVEGGCLRYAAKVVLWGLLLAVALVALTVLFAWLTGNL